ncbi:MAG: sigma-70 family RNA polymerase sigma factor [Spirochaetaceae bacterium]|nr:sigma-70 family RNA polymerase sigma factor [Spirochaetaceae bacterium]
MKEGGASRDRVLDDTLTDNEIVEIVLSGRAELYRLLIERHEKKVFAMGRGFFRNKDEARDFTQEVFLKAFHALPRFEGRSSFATWLFRIAYNQAVNGKRGLKEYLSLVDSEDTAVSEAVSFDMPEHNLLKKNIKEAVRTAVRELPEKYRICIDLSFFYELTYEEIARITAFPVNTVKSHILRAKRILREKLSAIGGADEA